MEPNRPQVMPIEKTGKLLPHIVGLDDVIFLINADVVALPGAAVLFIGSIDFPCTWLKPAFHGHMPF